MPVPHKKPACQAALKFMFHRVNTGNKKLNTVLEGRIYELTLSHLRVFDLGRCPATKVQLENRLSSGCMEISEKTGKKGFLNPVKAWVADFPLRQRFGAFCHIRESSEPGPAKKPLGS